MSNEYMNVKEPWFLYDTVAVSSWVDTLDHKPSGWYGTFAGFSGADAISFFDSRNKSIGLAYNNQESRDQVPYALVVETLSIGFFAPATGSQIGTVPSGESGIPGRADQVSTWWEIELPQHTSCVFRVNQDDRLKTNCAMLSPGYGPVGGMMGQGDMAADQGGRNTTVHAQGMGISHLKYRWKFPTGIGVPRRATMVVELRMVEWARDVLDTLWGPGQAIYRDSELPDVGEEITKPTMFMIQCLVTGRREVQQRGEYHA